MEDRKLIQNQPIFGIMLTASRMIFIMIWWFVSARKWFKGPHINVEHHMLGRSVVEGVGGDEDEISRPPSYSRGKDAGTTEVTPELKG